MSQVATQIRWGRRLFLLAFVIGGLWLIGFLGHTGQAHADPLARPSRPALVSRQSHPFISAARIARPAASMIVEKTVTRTVVFVDRPVRTLLAGVGEPSVGQVVQPAATTVVQPVLKKVVRPILGGLQPILGSTNPPSPVWLSVPPVSSPSRHVTTPTTPTRPTASNPMSKQAALFARSVAASNQTTSMTGRRCLTAAVLLAADPAASTAAAAVAHRPAPAPRPVPSPSPVTVPGGTATAAGAHQSPTGFDLAVSHRAGGVVLRGQTVAHQSPCTPREQAHCPPVSPD